MERVELLQLDTLVTQLIAADETGNGYAWGGLFSSAFFTADSAPMKPILECWPSQNGLFKLPPQRHSENAGLPVRSNLLPAGSTRSTVPSGASTRYGPFGRTVIFTWAIIVSVSRATESKREISNQNSISISERQGPLYRTTQEYHPSGSKPCESRLVAKTPRLPPNACRYGSAPRFRENYQVR